MRVVFWGVRGSLPTPGPETERIGGNTPCIEVLASDGSRLILDAGTGLRRLGASLAGSHDPLYIFLTHLHMDHIQGLGFFGPLYHPRREIHLWGPSSSALDLRARLTRYLSPPLFPVRLRDLPSALDVRETAEEQISIGPFTVRAEYLCHPGPTVGYRIECDGAILSYIPDHEPFLGPLGIDVSADWISGFSCADGADLLIHDAQYTDAEYQRCIGWGHSSFEQAIAYAKKARVKHLVAFHHDPDHSDQMLTSTFEALRSREMGTLDISVAAEGQSVEVPCSR